MPSTVIKSIAYERSKELLVITFVSGIVYQYLQVPAEIYDALKQSASKGSYFNNNIKGNFSFERLSP